MFIVGILLSAGICARFGPCKMTTVFASGVISSIFTNGPFCSLLPLWTVRLMFENDGFDEKSIGQRHPVNSYSNCFSAGSWSDVNRNPGYNKASLPTFPFSPYFVAAQCNVVPGNLVIFLSWLCVIVS